MKLVSLSYLEGRPSLYSTFVKLMMMVFSVAVITVFFTKRKKKNIYDLTLLIFSVKQTWIWSFQSF